MHHIYWALWGSIGEAGGGANRFLCDRGIRMRQSQTITYNNGCTISALSCHYPSAASWPCITLKLVWHYNVCVWHYNTCMCARACVRLCACVCVAEQRNPFRQSGQCWKQFKDTSIIHILLCLVITLTLFNMFYWNEKIVLWLCVSAFAFVCLHVCVCVTESKRQLAWRRVSAHRKCAVIMFFFLLCCEGKGENSRKSLCCISLDYIYKNKEKIE